MLRGFKSVGEEFSDLLLPLDELHHACNAIGSRQKFVVRDLGDTADQFQTSEIRHCAGGKGRGKFTQ